jgi:hypothetical protein
MTSNETLNADVVLAALDQMLAPNTFHKATHLGTMKLQAKKLRAHVAQYSTTTPPATGEEAGR